MAVVNKLTQDQSEKFLRYLSSQPELTLRIEPSKNLILADSGSGDRIFDFRMPWFWPSLENFSEIDNYLERLSTHDLFYLIILIQAGHSALGTFRAGQILKHKVIQKYMVRKKQGKAQITYLHTKGKTRGGSRIRLAQTVEFFEEINEKIREWAKEENFGRILISCPARLWGLLFHSKISPPFEKKDTRFLKIPVDVQIPKFAELKRINYLAQFGSVHLRSDEKLEYFKAWFD